MKVDLDLFTARSNFESFSIGKVKKVDFSETIAACYLKVGKYRQQIEIMKKVCEYLRSRLFLGLGPRSGTY